jgi:hypothetical protein
MYLCAMKRVLLYFLVACFLSGSIVVEACKIPLLIFHYLDHVSRNPNVGVMNFLSMHYWGKDIKDSDKDQDMKLPFKKTVYFTHQILFCNTQINHLPNTDCLLSDQSPLFYRSKIIALSVSQLYRLPQSI